MDSIAFWTSGPEYLVLRKVQNIISLGLFCVFVQPDQSLKGAIRAGIMF